MGLKESRREIDRIDREIVELLKKRFSLVEGIGKEKQKLEMVVEDWSREQTVLENYKKTAGDELDEGFITRLVELILSYSKRVQGR